MSIMHQSVKKTAYQVAENHASFSLRQRMASFLSSIPEPAAQSAALQLIRNDLSMDKSLAFSLGLIGLAVLEEMI
jgi:zinc transporter ZupT